MSNTGIYQRADYAIFADPGAENPKTYELLEWLLKWQSKNNGISIYVVKKNLYEDLLKQENSTGQKFVSIPVFAKKGLGILRRQCTYEYKVMVINKKIRELHKLKPRQWMKPTEVWIGITTDEASRMKDSRHFNITNKYPLVDLRMNRLDCKKWLEDNDFPVPVKSSCVFCPYASNTSWLRNKKNKEVWSKVKKIDLAIRHKEELDEEFYLHRSCKPIDEVYLQEDQGDLFENECEGYCGI